MAAARLNDDQRLADPEVRRKWRS